MILWISIDENAHAVLRSVLVTITVKPMGMGGTSEKSLSKPEVLPAYVTETLLYILDVPGDREPLIISPQAIVETAKV